MFAPRKHGEPQMRVAGRSVSFRPVLAISRRSAFDRKQIWLAFDRGAAEDIGLQQRYSRIESLVTGSDPKGARTDSLS